MKWHHRDATQQERQALLDWTPSPLEPGSFDHLFHTRFGNLDVVPVIAGQYAELAPRASSAEYAGTRVLVASVSALLATLTIPRRAKDADRVRFLRTLQQEKGKSR